LVTKDRNEIVPSPIIILSGSTPYGGKLSDGTAKALNVKIG